MVKVAIVCGAGIVSGKEIMALELAKGLRKKGCSVDVVTSFWGNGEFLRRLQDEKLPAHVMRLGFISASFNFESIRMTAHQMLYWPGLLKSYKRFLNNVKPEKVIHTNWQHLLLLWPCLNAKRDFFWVHDITPRTLRYRKLFRTLDARLRSFVPVSYAVAESLKNVGIDKAKIHVIHSGIEDTTREMDAPNSEKPATGIGIVGQVAPWKGHEDLLPAFAQVVASFPATQLHVFGKGRRDYQARLKKEAATLGISEKIVWHGFVNDRAKIYQSMDICVVPSRCDEALGMVAIEAGLCGIPVVASRRGGLQEVIEDQVTGLLFPSGDIEQLASSLNRLLGDAHLRQEMGKQARLRVAQSFGRDRFIGDFFQLLKAA
jgi:glycosyltransferase involved in cell wall biosynthesis